MTGVRALGGGRQRPEPVALPCGCAPARMPCLDFLRLKLVRLFRVLRLARILRRLDVTLGLRGSTVALAKLTVLILILAHWCACLLFLLAELQFSSEDGAPAGPWPRAGAWA